jgi:hypothetical protein
MILYHYLILNICHATLVNYLAWPFSWSIFPDCITLFPHCISVAMQSVCTFAAQNHTYE